MLTNNQRRFLRKLSNDMEASFQIGKEGIGSETLRHLDNMLRTRELVKVSILKHAPDDVRETADNIAGALGADVVQTIGRRFIIYRRSEDRVKEGKAIQLPRT